jgi:FMN phosphatase YigB (HAD superfamily)
MKKIILVDAIHTLIIPDKGIYDPLFNLLETYPNRKIVLTGANDKEFSEHGLDKISYEVFTLKHNPEKSDPNYYKILLEKLDLAVEDLVYIEHNLEAVHSAESLNINAFHYNKDLRDINKLNEFLKINI